MEEKELLENLQELGEEAENAVTGLAAEAEEAAEAAEETVEEAVEAVEETVEETIETAEEAVETAEETVEEVIENAEEAVETAEETVEEVIETAEEAAGTAEETVEEIIENAEEAAGTAEETVEEIIENAEEAVGTAEETVEEVVENAEEAVATAEETAEEVIENAEEAAETAEETVEEVIETAEEAAETAEETVEETEEAAGETVKKATASKKAEKKAAPAKKNRKGLIIGIIAAVLLLATVGGLLLPLFSASNPFKKNGTVLSVEGLDIKADEFSYYVKYMMDMYSYYYGEEYFKDPANMQSLIEYVTGYLTEHYEMVDWAKKNGVTVDDSIKADTMLQLEQLRSNYDTEEDFQAALKANHLTEELYLRMLNYDKVVDRFSEMLVSPDNKIFTVSDEEVASLADAFGIYTAKHILISFPENEEETEAKKAEAEAIYARVTTGGEDFDKVMKETSEDPGSLTNPDGYTFGNGEMVEEFYAAAQSLQENEISEIFESTYGWHIMKRLPLNLAEARTRVYDNLAYSELQSLVANANVKYCSYYPSICYEDFVEPAETAAQ